MKRSDLSCGQAIIATEHMHNGLRTRRLISLGGIRIHNLLHLGRLFDLENGFVTILESNLNEPASVE
jgi:hypothetical protein